MTTPPAPPRFALLRHECPADYGDGPHWDLMLERSRVDAEHRLATWSLLELPAAWLAALGKESATAPGSDVAATRLPDHRAAYLDDEGPLSGDRGWVERWAGGPIEWLADGPDRVEVVLPPPIGGVIELTRSGDDAWSLRWRGV